MKKTKLFLFIATFVLTVVALSVAVNAEGFHNCTDAKYDIVCEGKQMTVKCNNCGKTYGSPIEIDLADNAVIKLDDKVNLKVQPASNDNISNAFSLIYEGRNGTKYSPSSNVPHGAGDYYVFLVDRESFRVMSFDYRDTTTEEERQKMLDGIKGKWTTKIPVTIKEELSGTNFHGEGCSRNASNIQLCKSTEDGKLYARCKECGIYLYSYATCDAKEGQSFCLDEDIKVKYVELDGDKIEQLISDFRIIYSPEYDFDESKYTDEKPTEEGKYKIRLVSGSVWYNYEDNHSVATLNTSAGCSGAITVEFTAPVFTAAISGSHITAKCETCGKEYSDKSISIGEESGATTCIKGTAKVNGREEWNAAGLPEYAIVYHVGSNYTLTTPKSVPSGSTACAIALTIKDTLWKDYTDGKITIDKAITEEVPITFTKHKWTYSVDGYTINADCENCADHASVRIDTSSVYAAARNLDIAGMKYDLYVDEGWKDKTGIAEYCCIYDGFELLPNGSTTKYIKTEIRPQLAGNFTVKLGILNKAGKVIMTTEPKGFYIADMQISTDSSNSGFTNVEVVDYGPTQISGFTEPKSETKNGTTTYYVGTKSELLWCLYNFRKDVNTTISITDDIIVNPLTVTVDGKVYSASRQVYRWNGFDNSDSNCYFCINGNGHTIYGLFHDGNGSDFTGFCKSVKHFDIINLTIENSVFNGVYAGAFIGKYTEYNNNSTLGVIGNCKSYFNKITAGKGAGGFVGYMDNYLPASNSISGFRCEKLINRSYIRANSVGGIIGATGNLYGGELNECRNISDLYGDSDAGGMVGFLNLATGSHIEFEKCVNYGTITGEADAGGIVGYISGVFRFEDSWAGNRNFFNKCSNFGKITVFDSECPECYNQIIGQLSYNIIEGLGNKFFPYFEVTPFTYTLDNNDISPNAGAYGDTVTEEEVKSGLPCWKFGCIENDYFSDVTPSSCTEAGVMIKKCAICGKELYRVESKPHGHIFEYKRDEKTGEDINSCNYCGILYSQATGSIFGNNIVMIAIIAAAVLAAGAVAFIIIKKKKKATAE